MEEVTKCRYIDCVDTREKEQILHELPVCDTSLCVRWLINSGHVDLIGSDLDTLRSMKFFVCNNHFTEDCYLSKGTLKENAVPSPHWSAVSRTLRNLKTRRKVQLNGQESSMEQAASNHLAEKNVPSEFEVDQWCRTCATKKQNLVSMTNKGKGTDMSLLSKLKLLIEIDDEDVLPTKMCDECVDKLEQSFKFFQQIYVADNTLRHVFPTTRTSNIPRKPLQSIGEHMRNEQREKQKEKEKEEEQQQQQQLQDHTPKVSRGIFRRGRGRPRTRGYAARARSRQRTAQIHVSVASVNANNSIARESKTNDAAVVRNETQNTSSRDEERQGDTVFSLLTDTCHSDEELDWSDVLKVMSDQRYRPTSRQETVPKASFNVQTKLQTEVIKSDGALKTEPAIELTLETVMEEAKVQTKIPVKVEEEEEAGEGEGAGAGEEEGEENAQPSETKPDTGDDGQQIRCEFCKVPFKLRRQLQTHLLTDHSELSGHMCTDCLTCYENKFLLLKHRNMRHRDRRYRCEHCEEVFLEKRVLREHVSKCPSFNPPYYSCDLCGTEIASKQALINHMKTHPERTGVSIHPSSEMLNKAQDESDLTPKLQVETEQGNERFAVTSPKAVQISKSTLDETVTGPIDTRVDAIDSTASQGPVVGKEQGPEQKEIAGQESTPICPDCNEQMQDTVELSIHRMRRHSMNRKDATCLLCDSKSFSSLEEYEQHVLDHCKRLRISP